MHNITKQWLTGFFEGDGCLYNKKITEIIFVQKYISILKYIQEILQAGNINRQMVYGKYESFRHVICGKTKCTPIVELLSENVVSLASRRRIGTYLGVELDRHKITLPWLVGFWDAEGWSNLGRHGIGIGIGTNDYSILEEAKDMIGGNIFSTSEKYKDKCGRLQVYGDNAREFIHNILTYSRHKEKANKILRNLNILNSRNWKRSQWKQLANKINELYCNSEGVLQSISS